jgi:hypothetical protein
MTKLILVFLSLLSLPLSAQSSAPKGALKVRFLAERSPAGTGQVSLVAKEAKSPLFDLPISHLSAPQTPPERVFAVWSTGLNVSLATVTLPEEGNQFIVLLVPSKEGGFKPVVISAKDTGFRPGDIYFYNHADKTVLGYVGTATFTLEPGMGKSLRPDGAKGDNLYYDVGLGVREKEGDRTLSKARWPVQKQMRMYVFFYINPTNGRLDFRAVDEFVEPEAPAEP